MHGCRKQHSATPQERTQVKDAVKLICARSGKVETGARWNTQLRMIQWPGIAFSSRRVKTAHTHGSQGRGNTQQGFLFFFSFILSSSSLFSPLKTWHKNRQQQWSSRTLLTLLPAGLSARNVRMRLSHACMHSAKYETCQAEIGIVSIVDREIKARSISSLRYSLVVKHKVWLHVRVRTGEQ